MSGYYKLVNRQPVSCGLDEWARGFEEDEFRVDKTDVGEGVWVSTVFLGLDHSFGVGRPLLFETMIFGGPHDQYQERCSTWDQAEEQHRIAVQLAKAGAEP